MYLAIDTSTSWMGLALGEVTGGSASGPVSGAGHQGQTKSLIAEMEWHTEQNHSVELLPNLVNLLKQVRREIKEVEAVCVALGPGSFNGLRVGLSAAKGLAYGLRIPLAGVSTLEAEAYPFFYSNSDICALHSAGRGEVAAAIFRRMRGKWIRLLEEKIFTPEALCAEIKRQTIFCGEMPEDVEKILVDRLGALALFPHAFMRARRAGNILCLGMERLMRGEKDDPATLQPLYLRRPPITMPKKARFGAV